MCSNMCKESEKRQIKAMTYMIKEDEIYFGIRDSDENKGQCVKTLSWRSSCKKCLRFPISTSQRFEFFEGLDF